MMIVIQLSSLFLFLPLINGHGNMVKPAVWSDAERKMWWFDEHGSGNHLGCGVIDTPEDNEYTEVTGKVPDCLQMWYSNHVEIPGESTIPDELVQPEVKCVGQAGHDNHHVTFPWHAPGTAPVFSPCGAMGGNPYGCDMDGKGKFGDCCSGNCDAFALGDLAEEYDWPDAPTTEWRAGTEEEVAWYVSANHAGGYSYRLCKTPKGGIRYLTEECFQSGQLDFVGDKQWVEYGADRKTHHRTELIAKRTTKGTFPPGSMWTANPILPDQEEGGDYDYGHGHVIDKIRIPSSLESGEYVLSMRWDCKCSPQVWAFCSNVRITN